ncbi:AraC family transcriptional regulator [Brevundimonas sp.]|uniref:AraC family transcriptional regulator n=1 Tax=Brevundimonas sp. TaxID=1871086 RepID=UPI002FD9A894
MAMTEIDVIVRVAGATLLLWAAFGPGGARAAARRFFIPLAICVAAFLAGNTPAPELRLSGGAARVCMVLTGYAAVFLWWWCLAVFDQSFRPRGAVLALGIAWIVIASADRGLFGETLENLGLSRILVALGLVMVAHLTWRLILDRTDDMIDRRRRARGIVVAVLAAQLLTDLAVDLVFGFDWSPQAFTIAQNAAFLAFTGWLLSLDLADEPVWTETLSARRTGAERRQEAPLDPRLTTRLNHLLEVDRLHLVPDLTFEQFVKAMDAPERTVRRLINQQLGYDHFRTFLNAHRVEEAKRRLADPAHRDDKLIAIAMDSGFASLPSFNRVFRDRQGCAPSAFRAASRTTFEERSAGF